MNDKYISIITNFGCHYTCPYCIVKNNNLNIPKTTINGLDSLWLETVRNQCNWISFLKSIAKSLQPINTTVVIDNNSEEAVREFLNSLHHKNIQQEDVEC